MVYYLTPWRRIVIISRIKRLPSNETAMYVDRFYTSHLCMVTKRQDQRLRKGGIWRKEFVYKIKTKRRRWRKNGKEKGMVYKVRD